MNRRAAGATFLVVTLILGYIYSIFVFGFANVVGGTAVLVGIAATILGSIMLVVSIYDFFNRILK